MYPAALFTIAKIRKQPKCLSTDKWIKIWCVYIYIYIYTYTCTHTPIVKHFSVKKKGEIFLFVTTWMDLEGIMLSEIRQTKKEKYHIVSFI